jgi:hypothetical protein
MSSAAKTFVETGRAPRTQYPGFWWVRIKPYAPKAGNVVQSMTLRKIGKTFVEKTGWYSDKYTREQIAVLLSTLSNRHNPSSNPVFDVCTWEEANALDQSAKLRVKAEGGRRRNAEDVVTGAMTRADLPDLHAPAETAAPRERRAPKVGPQPPAKFIAPVREPEPVPSEFGDVTDEDVDFDEFDDEPQDDRDD